MLIQNLTKFRKERGGHLVYSTFFCIRIYVDIKATKFGSIVKINILDCKLEIKHDVRSWMCLGTRK